MVHLQCAVGIFLAWWWGGAVLRPWAWCEKVLVVLCQAHLFCVFEFVLYLLLLQIAMRQSHGGLVHWWRMERCVERVARDYGVLVLSGALVAGLLWRKRLDVVDGLLLICCYGGAVVVWFACYYFARRVYWMVVCTISFNNCQIVIRRWSAASWNWNLCLLTLSTPLTTSTCIHRLMIIYIATFRQMPAVLFQAAELVLLLLNDSLKPWFLLMILNGLFFNQFHADFVIHIL